MTARGRARRALPLLALVTALVVAGLFGSVAPEGPPLDPNSTGQSGTKALVELLRELGAEVTIAPEPGDRTDVALLLADFPDQRRAENLRAWTARGGTLVVADPFSPLAPEVTGSTELGFVDATLPRACAVAALGAAERVAAPSSNLLEVPPGATGCYRRGGAEPAAEENQGAWLVVRPEGRGQTVALGGPEALVNRYLGQADNAVLAAALLAPTPGTRVTVLSPPAPGEGQASLTDLIPLPVKLAAAQLAVAFLAFCAWRARRLGRPVSEPMAVAVPGSELVVAVANLLQQARARGRAADLLRADLRRTLAERLGLAGDADSATIAQRAGVPAADVRGLLDAAEPPDEATLVALARRVEQVRTAALQPAGAPGTDSDPEVS